MDWKSGGGHQLRPDRVGRRRARLPWFLGQGQDRQGRALDVEREIAPTLRDYVDSVGANFGRVRIIKLEPQDREQAMKSIHRDDNNRFNPRRRGMGRAVVGELTDNPDSYMLLMDNDARRSARPVDRASSATAKGARFVVDTQRLWPRRVHNGDAPRYALITSFESGPALEAWIDSQRATATV